MGHCVQHVRGCRRGGRPHTARPRASSSAGGLLACDMLRCVMMGRHPCGPIGSLICGPLQSSIRFKSGYEACAAAVPLLLLLLQRPLGPLRVEPHALERSLLGRGAALEVEARVGEPLEGLGLRHRQADDDGAGSLGILLDAVGGCWAV